MIGCFGVIIKLLVISLVIGLIRNFIKLKIWLLVLLMIFVGVSFLFVCYM